ncbi:MAG: hypothetical protein V3W06_10245, partial [Acidimicrobiia bacterium]
MNRWLRLPRMRTKALLVLAGVGALALAACSSSTTAAPAPAPEPAQALPAAEAPEAQVVGSGIRGGDPEFTRAAMVWQGYWLSRDHFGPLVMASGMGIPFQPPMGMVQMAMQMVAQNPDDPAMVPQNMMPL